MKDNNMSFCRTKSELPYPGLNVECKNPEYANAMLSNIGSGNSEMTAVSLYFYNSVILKPEYENLGKCFMEISIVEMHHLDMFATLAYNLGQDPRLWSSYNCKMSYWTPGYNKYPREVGNVIRNAIEGEKAAIRKYRDQASYIKDKTIVAVLERIILDEEQHIVIFNNMLNMLS